MSLNLRIQSATQPVAEFDRNHLGRKIQANLKFRASGFVLKFNNGRIQCVENGAMPSCPSG